MLFIDFKHAHDSLKRGKLILALVKLQILMKLLRLVKMTPYIINNTVVLEGNLQIASEAKTDLNKEETHFNLALDVFTREVREYISRATKLSIYVTVIKPSVLFKCKLFMLNKQLEAKLDIGKENFYTRSLEIGEEGQMSKYTICIDNSN